MTRKARTTPADETELFKQFWADWRKIMNPNDGRGGARDAYFKHVREYGVDEQDIVDGARQYILEGGNSRCQRHASTWINDGGYEDRCEAWRDRQAKIEAARRPSNVVPILQSPSPEPVRPPEHERAALVKKLTGRLV